MNGSLRRPPVALRPCSASVCRPVYRHGLRQPKHTRRIRNLAVRCRISARSFPQFPLGPPVLRRVARQKNNLEAALRGYKELNLRAIKILNPGGYLVTCSCSFHVSESDLLELVASAALDAHRTAVVVERRMQSRDHPVLLTVPETHYLKCLILRVL